MEIGVIWVITDKVWKYGNRCYCFIHKYIQKIILKSISPVI